MCVLVLTDYVYRLFTFLFGEYYIIIILFYCINLFAVLVICNILVFVLPFS